MRTLTPRRLIPAHAGKTWLLPAIAGGVPAHPRSRGENGGRVAGLRGLRGSSPLTRGKLTDLIPALAGVRLIPAHAGKTLVGEASSEDGGAHPRSRGENELRELSGFHHQGSSPLTRGKPCELVTARAGGRLIPAHAGKTR